MRAPLILCLCLLTLPTTVAAQAIPPMTIDDDLDAGRARAAVLRGEILPLEKILDIVRRDFPGQIIEIELEMEDGIMVYEFEILSPDGRLNEIDINAATGKVISIEEDD